MEKLAVLSTELWRTRGAVVCEVDRVLFSNDNGHGGADDSEKNFGKIHGYNLLAMEVENRMEAHALWISLPGFYTQHITAPCLIIVGPHKTFLKRPKVTEHIYILR